MHECWFLFKGIQNLIGKKEYNNQTWDTVLHKMWSRASSRKLICANTFPAHCLILQSKVLPFLYVCPLYQFAVQSEPNFAGVLFLTRERSQTMFISGILARIKGSWSLLHDKKKTKKDILMGGNSLSSIKICDLKSLWKVHVRRHSRKRLLIVYPKPHIYIFLKESENLICDYLLFVKVISHVTVKSTVK